MSLKVIGGKWKGRLLKAPKGPNTRPTLAVLREAVFNMCQNQIEGAYFLDLFAGSGAIGLEALSRGASFSCFVEKDPAALKAIKENIKTLQAENQTQILPFSLSIALKKLRSNLFNLVYIDPPYGMKIEPFMNALALHLVKEATVFIEERYDPKSKRAPLPIPELSLIDQRRFGIALLSLYKKL